MLKGSIPNADEQKEISINLRNWVGKEIGPIAKPDEIRFGDNLPKTRSGKIMRRLLRTLAKNEEITQDTSTLENPGILEQLKKLTRTLWRGDRVVEGARLESVCMVKCCTEGSNPSLSAI